jgi:maltokinase
MTEPVQIPSRIDDEALRDWLTAQRWFASKSRTVIGLEIVEQLALGAGLVVAIVQVGFAAGTHELYQLTLVAHDAEVAFDGLDDPAVAHQLLARIESGEEIETGEGRFSFRCVAPFELPDDAPVRAMGVEQSNSSIVFDDRFVLKVFRKLESGINPELEMLRFLTAHEFPNIAPLSGWYEYEGVALAATLGVVQEFLPEGDDGWALALDEIPSRPDAFLDRIAALGTATAQMHSCLATDIQDPAFSPEDPSQEAIALLTATIDEDIERIFLRLDESDTRLEPILGRGQDVRERLAARAQVGIGGKHIRLHGDYHLGQTLYAPRGWVILDFEGEPARPLPERRMKRPPLRDVASMLRSFAYATSAVELLRGGRAPDGFEAAARERFLGAYFEAVDPALLPAGHAAIDNMLAIFELEKAIYELRYELDNRPDWVPIPVAGIARLLESVA